MLAGAIDGWPPPATPPHEPAQAQTRTVACVARNLERRTPAAAGTLSQRAR